MKGTLIVLLAFCFLQQIVLAIDVDKIFHNPNDIFYVNPAVGEVRLKTARDNLTEAYVVTDSLNTKMEIKYADDDFDYFAANINKFDSTLAYHFILKDESDSLVFPTDVELHPAAPLFNPPGWASSKTYYVIATDGFYNGDRNNDPDASLEWGDKPKNWLAYGGDLKGIVQKIAYVDSLGADIIMLLPIFSASSNHKFNPNDYSTIDPAFGDTTDLRNLINECHRRNKKIVLSVIFSHTGIDFPAFADILKNGNLSKYFDWYVIDSTAINPLIPNYISWQRDPRFPTLNLRDDQVKNYLIGYIDYWTRFGFDGFYIGESEEIDADFIRLLRDYMKAKYPNLLLIGSDSRHTKGRGFDASFSRSFSKMIIEYFVKDTIMTSDFDNTLRRMLFFSPPQVNCLNLVGFYDYNTRLHKIANKQIIRNIFAFIFTFCGSPVIFYGNETGMSDCCPLNWGSFNWDPEKQNRELWDELNGLIKIRKTNQQISSRNFFTLYVNDITKVYAYDRGGLIVILNNGDTQAFVEIPAWDGVYVNLISGSKYTAYSQKLKLSIEPLSYSILKREI